MVNVYSVYKSLCRYLTIRLMDRIASLICEMSTLFAENAIKLYNLGTYLVDNLPMGNNFQQDRNLEKNGLKMCNF